jgi:hypothetical protein
VYYLNKDKTLVGILLFNRFGKMDQARGILKQGKVYTSPADLSGLISLH